MDILEFLALPSTKTKIYLDNSSREIVIYSTMSIYDSLNPDFTVENLLTNLQETRDYYKCKHNSINFKADYEQLCKKYETSAKKEGLLY